MSEPLTQTFQGLEALALSQGTAGGMVPVHSEVLLKLLSMCRQHREDAQEERMAHTTTRVAFTWKVNRAKGAIAAFIKKHPSLSEWTRPLQAILDEGDTL